MTDRHLVGPGDILQIIAQIVEIQIMTRIQAQAATPRLLGRSDIRRNRLHGIRRMVAGIGLRIEFHTIGSASRSTLHHRRYGIDKNRRPDTERLETGTNLRQECPVGHRVPAGIRRDGIRRIRHKRHLCRPNLLHQSNETIDRVAFDIELRCKHLVKRPDIVIANVTPVGTRMNRDPIGSEPFDIKRRPYHIGKVPAARITQNGDLVDVHTQLCHKIRIFAHQSYYFFGTSMMKLLLFSRSGIVHTADELRRVFAAVDRYGFDYAVNKEFAETIREAGIRQIPSERQYDAVVPLPADGRAAMVCFGGDGTLLEGIRRLDGAPIPVVGVNAGHMGFLTGGRREAINTLFEQIAHGNLRIEQRTMLEVEGNVAGLPRPALAINEAAVQRSGAGMIAVECCVDHQAVATYYGDGVIVSTPTGSTAYSLSAGGPVVAPGCQCLVISPLAPHNLTMRPIVIPDTSTISLRVHTRRSAVTLSIDNTAFDIDDGAEIQVTISKNKIFLGQAHNISFYDTLRNKLMWGVDIRE